MAKVKMKAPKGASSFATPDKSYTVPKDGLVEIDEQHAEIAKRQGFVDAPTGATGATATNG